MNYPVFQDTIYCSKIDLHWKIINLAEKTRNIEAFGNVTAERFSEVTQLRAAA